MAKILEKTIRIAKLFVQLCALTLKCIKFLFIQVDVLSSTALVRKQKHFNVCHFSCILACN